jgi:hypothetical protein
LFLIAAAAEKVVCVFNGKGHISYCQWNLSNWHKIIKISLFFDWIFSFFLSLIQTMKKNNNKKHFERVRVSLAVFNVSPCLSRWDSRTKHEKTIIKK